MIVGCSLFLLFFIQCNLKKRDYCTETINACELKLINANSFEDSLKIMSEFTKNKISGRICIEKEIFIADFYNDIGNNKIAKDYYCKVISADSTIVSPLYKLGVIYYDNNNLDSAIFFLTRALRLKEIGGFVMDYNNTQLNSQVKESKYDVPSNEIIYTIGLSYYYKRNLDSAYKYLNYQINNNYKTAEVLIYRGALLWEGGSKERACNDFIRAKELGNLKADYYLSKYCIRTK